MEGEVRAREGEIFHPQKQEGHYSTKIAGSAHARVRACVDGGGEGVQGRVPPCSPVLYQLQSATYN